MATDTDDGGDGGGIGKKLAIGAVVVLAVALVLRAVRGGGDDESDDDTTDIAGSGDPSDTTDIVGGSAGTADGGDDADGGLPVDTDVEGRFDEIDVVDAVYILVAGLKAAREEYRQRTDEGGA